MKPTNLSTSGRTTRSGAASVAREVVFGLAVGLASVALIVGFAIAADTLATVVAPFVIMLSTGAAVAAAFAGVRALVRRQSSPVVTVPAPWTRRYA